MLHLFVIKTVSYIYKYANTNSLAHIQKNLILSTLLLTIFQSPKTTIKMLLGVYKKELFNTHLQEHLRYFF